MPMKHFIYLPLILLWVSTALNEAAGQPPGKESNEVQSGWLKALQHDESLSAFYTKHSGILLGDSLYVGWTAIEPQVNQLNALAIERYTSDETFQLRDSHKFEMGTYHTRDGKTYSTIIGWRKGSEWRKEFEVIHERTFKGEQKDLVSMHRARWENLANQHRPDLIAQELASLSGKYFNRGVKYNRDEIPGAYAYMNNSSFSIKLEALKVLQVDDTILFDIGTFDVGGKGLYTLIWKKENGEWKLLLDFNF